MRYWSYKKNLKTKFFYKYFYTITLIPLVIEVCIKEFIYPVKLKVATHLNTNNLG